MNKLLLTIAMASLILGGCAFLDKMAPSKYDAEGNAIPGSREPIEIVSQVAGEIPYAGVMLNLILLGVAGWEKFQAARMKKGLVATLLAGKQVASDPELKELWEKVKETYYAQAHDSAGVTSLIKDLLAKLPTTKSI